MKKREKRKFGIEPYLYVLPAMILFFLFTFYPFLKTVILSFFRINAAGEVINFAGLENYKSILSNSSFRIAVKNSFKFAFVVTPVVLIIGLLLAILANKKTKTSKIYELMFALTMAVSSSVAAMIFKLMYNPTIGILNSWLNTKINWLNDPKVALLALIIIWIWLNVGYNFIFLLSAVRGIPGDIMESCQIDGASFPTKFFKVIIPMVSPTIFYLFITQLAGNLMMSALTLILTEGGPGESTQTMISFMIQQSVNNQNYNDGYAAAIIVFIITAITMLLAMQVEKKGVHYN